MRTLTPKLSPSRFPQWAEQSRGYVGLLAASLLGWFSGTFIEGGGYAAGIVYLFCVIAVPVVVCCISGRWYFFSALLSLLLMQASLLYLQWASLSQRSEHPWTDFVPLLKHTPFTVGISLLVSWAISVFFRRAR